MDASEINTAYHDWSDADLVGLLRQAGDRLPGDAVIEMAIRNETTQPLLWTILTDREMWSRAGQSSWAAIHAFLLYADYQMPEAEFSLEDRWGTAMAAVRYALAYGLDETYLADFPLVVSSQGRWVWNRLPALARDRSRPVRERRAWLMALADAAKREPDASDAKLDVLRRIAQGADEPAELRAFAARRLLDFVRPGDRPVIETVAEAEAAGTGLAEVLPEEVAEAYARGTPDPSPYIRNWQAFHYKMPGLGPEDAAATPEMPLPSWREAEIGRITRACAGLMEQDVTPGLSETAAFFLDTLVRRRLSLVRFWRTLDVTAACARAFSDPAALPAPARANFPAAAARFLEILGLRELVEVGDLREMAAWVTRRAGRIGGRVGEGK